MTQHKKENVLSGIEGKVVVITGASSGIGEATALLLASSARRVLGTSSTSLPQRHISSYRPCWSIDSPVILEQPHSALWWALHEKRARPKLNRSPEQPLSR